MLLSGILLIIVPLFWSIIESANSNPTEIGGFNFDGLLIIAGVIFCSVFCGCYGVLALILSLLTRRNITFRTLLIVIPVLAAVGFYIFFILQNSADYAQ
jgi:hypothetical protein